MTEFDTRFAARGAPKLLEKFGEPIVIKPHGGLARNVIGIVDRDPKELVDGMGRTTVPVATVTVLTDEHTGHAPHLFSKSDRVEFPERVGQPVSNYPLTDLISQTGGMATYSVG